MAVLQRQKYQAPTINNVTEQIFANLDALKYLYRNEEDFRSNKYDDIDQNSLIPSVLFWADRDLHYTVRRNLDDDYISVFTEIDPKVPLRGGNFKRTEVGYALPEMLTREDDKKPGEALTTPKQDYLTWWQDKNADIDDIHLRSCVDWHKFDFVNHFNDFSDYARVTMQTFNAINLGLNLLDKLCIDTFLISLFGGYLHTYPIGSPLYRFFGDAGSSDLLPDEQFSKDAQRFFKPDGNVAKKIKEIAKWTKLFYKAKFCYLTNTVEGEVIGSGADKKIPDIKAIPAKTTTKDECLKAIRSWYMRQDNNKKYVRAGFELRRLSLYAFLGCLTGTIRDLTKLDARNWCGHDFYSENKDKKGLAIQCRWDDLVVVMNDEDLEESRNLKGSLEKGIFTESLNGAIERMEARGVKFVGLDYVLPGHAAVFDKNLCFKLKEYYHADYNEFFAYHLVESRIKHVFKKPLIYGKTVFRMIQPGAGQQFSVTPYWASKHLPFLVEK